MKLCITLFPLVYPTITIFFLLSFFVSTHLSYAQDYKICQKNYSCGGEISVGFPFWGGDRQDFCGHPGFNLSCESETEIVGGSFTVIDMDGMRFRVVDIDESAYILRIARLDLWKLPCSKGVLENDTKLDHRFFKLIDSEIENLTLFYGCNGFQQVDPSLTSPEQFNCSNNIDNTISKYYVKESLLKYYNESEWFSDCKKNSIEVPMLNIYMEKLVSMELQVFINNGFDVEYPVIGKMCHDTCGPTNQLCAYNNNNSKIICIDNKPAGGINNVVKAAIGVAAAFTGAFLTFLGFCIYLRRKKRIETKSLILSRNISSEPSSKMDMEKGDVSFGFGVQVFTYDELVEATDNFASDRELGDGGFGTVYYGKLQDGRNVAVKRLYESNYKRVEQFMNEVKLLAHLRHKNLVMLYGCTSRHSRELLLVYEYIPNGTLADHLHGEYARPGALPWVIRLNTAIETADALTYLHKTDIIHRDIKTNNILLDKNFTVKVADFGLSRLFPVNATHVSTAPQGTPGYVDPEYHQCYQLTDKSDVFSFGVVLIELISSMTAVDITRHRHEINLSTMAINKIQNQTLHELVDPNLGFDSDKEIKRMITDVAECAFQCLQHEKDMRPSMEEVLEILQRIKNPDYDKPKSQGVDILAPDDAALLKKVQFSPVSVTVDWGSSTTTPNSSS